MQIIEIERLSRDYGEGRGIFDISFSIAEGEVFGFLGPNGAGKTTTIRHLLGFLKAKQGSAKILGMDCWKQSDAITRQLGYIPGEINLLNEMSGEEFLRFMARYRNMQDSGRTQELLERFELRPTGAIRRMSKGMKQKLGIVAAFMHDPKVLILDEPTSGLDPLMQNAFVELIQEEKQRGKTILMSSHMFEEWKKPVIASASSGRDIWRQSRIPSSCRRIKRRHTFSPLPIPRRHSVFCRSDCR